MSKNLSIKILKTRYYNDIYHWPVRQRMLEIEDETGKKIIVRSFMTKPVEIGHDLRYHLRLDRHNRVPVPARLVCSEYH